MQGGGKLILSDISQKAKEFNKEKRRMQVKKKLSRVEEKLKEVSFVIYFAYNHMLTANSSIFLFETAKIQVREIILLVNYKFGVASFWVDINLFCES